MLTWVLFAFQQSYMLFWYIKQQEKSELSKGLVIVAFLTHVCLSVLVVLLTIKTTRTDPSHITDKDK